MPQFLFQVETKDALLHAINEEYVEAVEVLLEHEEQVHKAGELHVRAMVKESRLTKPTSKSAVVKPLFTFVQRALGQPVATFFGAG